MSKISDNLVHVDLKLGEKFGTTVCEFLQSLLGEPLACTGAMIGDQIRFWRWNNALRLDAKAREKAKERGLTLTQLPKSFLLPLIDAAANTDDDDLLNLWAELVASGMADRDSTRSAFVKALESMSGVDAKVLQHIASTGCQTSLSNPSIPGFDKGTALNSVGLLRAVGIVAPIIVVELGRGFGPNRIQATTNVSAMELTEFGRAFLRAVSPQLKFEYQPMYSSSGSDYHIESVFE